MNRVCQVILFCSFSILLLASCSKPFKKLPDDPPVITNTGGPSTFPIIPLNELFHELSYTPEVQCVGAGFLDTVTFSKGTRVVFYPWSFRNAAGDTIIGAMVCVSVVEMFSPGDLILNRATGMATDGPILRNAGQVSITAKIGSEQVFVNKYSIAFKQPKPSTKRMDLHYGNIANIDTVARWTLVDSVGPGTTAVGTTTDSFYVFDSCAKFGLVGCQQLFDTASPKAVISIALAGPTSTSTNTSVYVVFPSINSVAVATYSKLTKTFLVGRDLQHKVASGMQMKVIAVSKNQGNYYYYEQPGVTAADTTRISTVPGQQTVDYIRTKLWAL